MAQESPISAAAQKELAVLFQTMENFNHTHTRLVVEHPDLTERIKSLAQKNHGKFIPLAHAPVGALDVTVHKHLVVAHDENGARFNLATYVDPFSHFTQKDLVSVSSDDLTPLFQYQVDPGLIKKINKNLVETVKKVKCCNSYIAMLQMLRPA